MDRIQFLAEKWKRTEDNAVMADLIDLLIPKLNVLVYVVFPKSSIKEDLVAVALADLEEALRNYDVTRDERERLKASFWTYYSKRVTGIMRHCRRDTELTIRVSRHSSDLVVGYHTYSNKFFSKHGRYPTIEESAKKLKVSPDNLQNHLKLNKNIRDGIISLSSGNYQHDNLNLSYTFPFDSSDNMYEDDIQELIKLVINKVPVTTVAQKLGCSTKKARESLKKIREYMDETLDMRVD